MKQCSLSLSQSRLFRWYIAPLLDDRLLDLPWVGPGPGANLLGDIHTFLFGFQLRHQFADMFAGSLGFQGAGLLGRVRDNGFGGSVAFLESLSNFYINNHNLIDKGLNKYLLGPIHNQPGHKSPLVPWCIQ